MFLEQTLRSQFNYVESVLIAIIVTAWLEPVREEKECFQLPDDPQCVLTRSRLPLTLSACFPSVRSVPFHICIFFQPVNMTNSSVAVAMP